MSTVTVRPAAPADAALVEVWLTDPSLAAFAEDPSERPGGIIELDGEPVGWIDPHPAFVPAWRELLGPQVGDEPWTLDLFLIASHRGRGIGRAAIRAVSEECLAAKATAMVVDIEPDNQASRRAFVAAGWVEVDTDQDAFVLRYP